jgi:hypothetical protein
MRPTKDDFKDKLAGKQDKVAAVKSIKEELATAGLKVKVTRRKLASGTKIYFTITPPVSLDRRTDIARNYSRNVIKMHFPEAILTSGGTLEWTIAEY